MLKRDVMYPAVVTKEDGVYYIGLVDFDRLEDGNINYYATYSGDLEKVSTVIRESLALYLADLLDMKKEFPEPAKLEDIKLKENQFIQVISVDPVYEAAKVTNVLKKKTVNIPAWLDIVAQEKKINFSQLLQKALKKELGIE
ncbi:hypothetical protein [Leptotrichia wadei]|uniref:Toxin-antitoxin system, antitoxin component, HicB family n=1 Tax=Leptotrichia wadei (strain F0279) TaxID=888055 RepID=U2PUM3_LEPWF|nr:hypothetical protein [Leptotrichia wadei]ERK47821.1 toxin-antitoxin system, antitoxin component, HicB family [Leptotrichia wadei F0279]